MVTGRRACPFAVQCRGHAHSSACAVRGTCSSGQGWAWGLCPVVAGRGGHARSWMQPCVRGTCSFFAAKGGHKGIMSTGCGQGRACPEGRTRLSAPPPRLDTPWICCLTLTPTDPSKLPPRRRQRTKSRSGSGLAGLDSGPDSAPARRRPARRRPARRTAAHGGTAEDQARTGFRTPANSCEGLNPQQEEAVKHAGSALLIVAGAGSGKTRVLSNRIAYLIATRRAHHGEILAITFTNKAAAEMRERIEALVGGRAKTMWISTFHSSCVRILRREADERRAELQLLHLRLRRLAAPDHAGGQEPGPGPQDASRPRPSSTRSPRSRTS